MDEITKIYYGLLLWAINETELDDADDCSQQERLDLYHAVASEEMIRLHGADAFSEVALVEYMEDHAMKLVGIYDFDDDGDWEMVISVIESEIY